MNISSLTNKLKNSQFMKNLKGNFKHYPTYPVTGNTVHNEEVFLVPYCESKFGIDGQLYIFVLKDSLEENYSVDRIAHSVHNRIKWMNVDEVTDRVYSLEEISSHVERIINKYKSTPEKYSFDFVK